MKETNPLKEYNSWLAIMRRLYDEYFEAGGRLEFFEYCYLWVQREIMIGDK